MLRCVRKFRVRWKTLCIAAISLTLSQGFSTFHDIDVFRCSVAEISDNLAGDKRLIVLTISVLQQIIAARSYKKTYHLAGAKNRQYPVINLYINIIRTFVIIPDPARLSENSKQKEHSRINAHEAESRGAGARRVSLDR